MQETQTQYFIKTHCWLLYSENFPLSECGIKFLFCFISIKLGWDPWSQNSSFTLIKSLCFKWDASNLWLKPNSIHGYSKTIASDGYTDDSAEKVLWELVITKWMDVRTSAHSCTTKTAPQWSCHHTEQQSTCFHRRCAFQLFIGKLIYIFFKNIKTLSWNQSFMSSTMLLWLILSYTSQSMKKAQKITGSQSSHIKLLLLSIPKLRQDPK